MDPVSLKLFLDEFNRRFDEMEARWDRRFPLSTREDHDAAEDLCVGAPKQIDAVVVADNWGGLFEQPAHVPEMQIADGNQDSGERKPVVKGTDAKEHDADLSSIDVFGSAQIRDEHDLTRSVPVALLDVINEPDPVLAAASTVPNALPNVAIQQVVYPCLDDITQACGVLVSESPAPAPSAAISVTQRARKFNIVLNDCSITSRLAAVPFSTLPVSLQSSHNILAEFVDKGRVRAALPDFLIAAAADADPPRATLVVACSAIFVNGSFLDVVPSLGCVVTTTVGVDDTGVLRRVAAADRYVRVGLWPSQGNNLGASYPLPDTLRLRQLVVTAEEDEVPSTLPNKCLMNCLILIQCGFSPPFSCSWDAVPHRQPWPPPEQFGMQGNGVRLRPTPSPSFIARRVRMLVVNWDSICFKVYWPLPACVGGTVSNMLLLLHDGASLLLALVTESRGFQLFGKALHHSSCAADFWGEFQLNVSNTVSWGILLNTHHLCFSQFWQLTWPPLPPKKFKWKIIELMARCGQHCYELLKPAGQVGKFNRELAIGSFQKSHSAILLEVNGDGVHHSRALWLSFFCSDYGAPPVHILLMGFVFFTTEVHVLTTWWLLLRSASEVRGIILFCHGLYCWAILFLDSYANEGGLYYSINTMHLVIVSSHMSSKLNIIPCVVMATMHLAVFFDGSRHSQVIYPVLCRGKGFKFKMMNADESYDAVSLAFANTQDLMNDEVLVKDIVWRPGFPKPASGPWEACSHMGGHQHAGNVIIFSSDAKEAVIVIGKANVISVMLVMPRSILSYMVQNELWLGDCVSFLASDGMSLWPTWVQGDNQHQPCPPPDELRMRTDVELGPILWSLFNMIERCSVMCQSGWIWKPPWPVPVLHQLTTAKTYREINLNLDIFGHTASVYAVGSPCFVGAASIQMAAILCEALQNLEDHGISIFLWHLFRYPCYHSEGHQLLCNGHSTAAMMLSTSLRY